MNPDPAAEAPVCRSREKLMWLCWITPGPAGGMMLGIYITWFSIPGEPWHLWILWGTVAGYLLGCCTLAVSFLRPQIGGERKISEIMSSAAFFLGGQIFIAPILGAIVAFPLLQ